MKTNHGIGKRSVCALGLAFAGSLLLFSSSAKAQFPGTPNGNPNNRLFNPYAIRLTRAWSETLQDAVKLIDVVPVTGDRANVLMLIEGTDPLDYKRKLRLTHWDGLRFSKDDETEFLGKPLDVLVTGILREAKPSTPVPGQKKPKRPVQMKQIVSSSGVYEWNEGKLNRFAEPPIGVKALIDLDKIPGYLLTGSGDGANLFTLNDAVLQQVMDWKVPEDAKGFVKYGVGMQDFEGADAVQIENGTRFVQAVWREKQRWFICLKRGKLAPVPGNPNATIGDKLVIYVPKLSARDKSFWQMHPEDLEPTEATEAIAGRVLDVRVGDPKNDGKEGILLLTSEGNDGKTRKLTFFLPDK